MSQEGDQISEGTVVEPPSSKDSPIMNDGIDVAANENVPEAAADRKSDSENTTPDEGERQEISTCQSNKQVKDAPILNTNDTLAPTELDLNELENTALKQKEKNTPMLRSEDVVPALNGIPDTSNSTTMVTTEADLQELEKTAQKNEVEISNIIPQNTEESESVKEVEDDDASIQTEESDDEKSSTDSSESDSDSNDESSSDDDSNSDDSSSSSNSSEDPSVLPDMDYDEEEAMLTKNQVYPNSSLMYADDYDEQIFSPEDELRHAFEMRFGDRATVRKMISQRLRGQRRLERDLHMRDSGTLGPSGRKAQRGRVNRRKKRALYAILATAIITAGVSLVIYALTKEREYNRTEEFGSNFVDTEEEEEEATTPSVTTILITAPPNTPKFPSTVLQPQPQQSPTTSPYQIQSPQPTQPSINDSELLSLIKAAYIDTFQSIPGTSGTNQATVDFVNSVDNNFLNPSMNSGITQSYQWQAYTYLYNSRSDVINKETGKIGMPAERIMQIYALYCFYLQVQFPQEGSLECEWSGVTCQDLNDRENSPYSVTSNMVVVSLDLPKWQLKGALPAELAFLSHIESLDLSNNQLSGSLPTMAMFKWKRLKVLSLHDNQFDSGLTSELGLLTSLQKLTIYHNEFEGATIPAEVCHLRQGQLHFLWVDCSTTSTSDLKVSCPEDCCTICFEPVGFGHDSEVGAEITSQLTHETHGADPNGIVLNKLKDKNDGGSGLDDINSPQYKSYVWLVTYGSYENDPDQIVAQKYALATLYFALAGSGWYQSTGWLTDEDVCNWFGVEDCNSGISSSLNLSSNNLVGEIPAELMSLRTLESISFADNELYGAIPPEIGTFTSLETLLLDNNVLTGTFPTELGNISTLKQLTLNSNELKGEVPIGVCSAGLVQLWADCLGPEVTCECCTKCYQYGEVHSIVEDAPADTNTPPYTSPLTETNEPSNEENPELRSMLIKYMSGLEDSPLSDKDSPSYEAYLWLAKSSNLSELDDFRKLQRFGLMALYFGTSPEFSWKIDSGWKTDAHECTWYGVICDDNTIVELSLPSNRLSGTIPPEFALSGLGGKVTVIDLSENSIGGNLPAEIGDFHYLSVLDLKNNAFTGTVPSELKHLTKLISLRLHSNEFEGAMPSEVCSLRNSAGRLAELSADCDPNDIFDGNVVCDTQTCCTICY